ncbi:MAG: AAA family ATPase [Gammaproteobacteria bacterium]
MYESFYGLKAKPFSMLPDPEFLYLSKKHRLALTMLEYTLMNNAGFCVITGEIGAGKTTLLRKLLSTVEDDVTIGMITNTHQSFGELLDWVLAAFGIHEPGLGKVEMHQRFVDFLLEQYASNKSTLLIVDEAQNMPASTLEEMRMLSNINSEQDLVLQVILAGQPELKDMLRKPELMQFAQRIAVDFHLDALNSDETIHYIQHRLVTAGATTDIFTPDACRLIAECSGGVPRLINLLCDTALVYGFADQCQIIDADLIEEVVNERLEHSILPLVKIDKRRNTSKEDNDNFPWINPEGGTKGLKPAAEKKTTEKKTTEKAASIIEQADAQANGDGGYSPRVDENNTETAEPPPPVAADGRSQHNSKAVVIPTLTLDAEQAIHVSSFRQGQVLTPDDVTRTAPGHFYGAARPRHAAPTADHTEKSWSSKGLILFALVILVLFLFLSLSPASYDYVAGLSGYLGKALSVGPINNDPAEIEFLEERAEIAEIAFNEDRTETEMLKQDLSRMQQQIEDMQRERDEALAKARQEQELRALDVQAAEEAARREQEAVAAAALAADEAQEAARQANKLAKQHRLENQRLREQIGRLEQVKQQTEAKQKLLEEQRKLVVLEWERIAREKAELERQFNDW